MIFDWSISCNKENTLLKQVIDNQHEGFISLYSHFYHYWHFPTMVGFCHGGNMLGNHHHRCHRHQRVERYLSSWNQTGSQEFWYFMVGGWIFWSSSLDRERKLKSIEILSHFLEAVRTLSVGCERNFFKQKILRYLKLGGFHDQLHYLIWCVSKPYNLDVEGAHIFHHGGAHLLKLHDAFAGS